MTMIEQLLQIQELLKKYSEELGNITLQTNLVIHLLLNPKMQENNQELAHFIQEIHQKINKKKARIQQEAKDRSIIHLKLNKAQNIKEQLEIKQSKSNQLHQLKEAKEYQLHQKPSKNVFENSPEKKKVEEQKHEIKSSSSSVISSNNQAIKSQQKQELSQKQAASKFYQNTGKGDYQPPQLFIDDEQSSQEEDDSKLKQKLGQDNDQDED